MNEQEALTRFGLNPSNAELPEIRQLLRGETRKERESQGYGDTELMKLLCVQLFNGGQLDDVLLIWNAKSASMDAAMSIDVQLLCGPGLQETKTYLENQPNDEAADALERIAVCEAAGDFEENFPAERAKEYAAYYA